MIEHENKGNGCFEKVLIAYSSLYGCTEDVALKIKKKLDNSSIKTEIVKINDKDQFKSLLQQDISQISSILLGSSIVAGNLHKNITKFLARLESTSLNERKLGLYICCMKACDNKNIIEAKNQYLEPILKKHNLKFSLVDAFGGKLDFSPNSPMNFMTKGLLKKILLKNNPDLKKIEPKVYDFRDWQQIENFASSWLNIIKNG